MYPYPQSSQILLGRWPTRIYVIEKESNILVLETDSSSEALMALLNSNS